MKTEATGACRSNPDCAESGEEMSHGGRRATGKPARKPSVQLGTLKPKQTPEAVIAEMVVKGVASNALIAQQFSKSASKSLDLTECMSALTSAVEAIRRGDLRGPEALLTAQSVSLNTMFTRLALVAFENMRNLDASERLMRLAFKAQSQCRTTVETLAAIKNPPTVFARQANITNGPQQVNNAFPPSRAGILETRRSELLEGPRGERLDLGAASAAGAGDQALATVGALNRPTER